MTYKPTSLSLAVLVFASACSETAMTPTEPGGPLLAVAAGTYHPVFDPTKAPSGTHVQTGDPSCTVAGGVVSCSSYELAGVGNTNAQADLNAAFSATVDCTNKGGKLVPVKAQAVTSSFSTGQLESKNGRLAVPALASGQEPPDADFEAAATCPNGNWTKSVRPGSKELDSFIYTLTFVGFAPAYITIAGS